MKKRILGAVLAGLLLLQGIMVPAFSKREPELPAETSRFTLSLEFYTAMDPLAPITPSNAKVQDPMQLKKDQEIVVAIHYSGLSGMRAGGVQCLAASLRYDPAQFILPDFDTSSADVAEWTDDGQTLSAAWASEALRGAYYTCSASDRIEEGGGHRIYLQYIAEENQAEGSVLTEDEGYLGAFTMLVAGEFSSGTIGWADYAAGLYAEAGKEQQPARYNKAALDALDGTQFTIPEDAEVSTGKKGVTVKGQVQSYARCVATNVYLYAFNADGSAPVYRDKRVLKETPYKCEIAAYQPTDAGAHNTSIATQDFTFSDIPAGKYTLVVEKKGCTFYVVEGLEVGTAELDLTKSDNSQVSTMRLVQGDLDGNGTVTVDDFNEAYLEQNWGKNDTEAAKPECDLDGNGVITVDDFNTAYLEQNWLEGDIVISLTA